MTCEQRSPAGDKNYGRDGLMQHSGSRARCDDALIKDIVDINEAVCRELWHMVSPGQHVEALTPRLIFPGLRSGDARVSEQEARFIYCSVLNRCNGYFYSVETPTAQLYSFSGLNPRSALSDISLYSCEDGAVKDKPCVNVELKAGNPSAEQIEKDVKKLVQEKQVGNWFHCLSNIDSSTLGVLFKKLELSFQGVASPVTMIPLMVFCFCVLDKHWGVVKCFDPSHESVSQFFDFQYAMNGAFHQDRSWQRGGGPLGIWSEPA